MSKEQLPFLVPQELLSEVDDHVLAVHESYQSKDLDSVKEEMGKQTPGSVMLLKNNGGDPEAGISVLALPHQQAWKPHMAIRSLIHHKINNPEGVTIVLPNNGFGEKSYDLSESDRKKIHEGDMRPFYEHQASSVEKVLERYSRLGAVSLDGYSLGGLTVAGIASVGSDRMDVAKVHSYEAPNKQTTPGKLQRAFLSSGTSLKNAIEDASVPALSEAMKPRLKATDFVKFGLASVIDKDNKALGRGMANPEYASLVEKSLANYDDLEFVAGHIAGSKLFDPEVVEYIRDPRFTVDFINEGPGSHKHTTGDNVMAHALMMKR